MTKIFLNWMKSINLQNQKSQWISKQGEKKQGISLNPKQVKKTTPGHIIIKLLKTYKSRMKRQIMYREQKSKSRLLAGNNPSQMTMVQQLYCKKESWPPSTSHPVKFPFKYGGKIDFFRSSKLEGSHHQQNSSKC